METESGFTRQPAAGVALVVIITAYLLQQLGEGV